METCIHSILHGGETKIGAAFHNGLRIKPIKLERVINSKTSSRAKVQNIFVTCKFFQIKARRDGLRIENKQASRQMIARLICRCKDSKYN